MSRRAERKPQHDIDEPARKRKYPGDCYRPVVEVQQPILAPNARPSEADAIEAVENAAEMRQRRDQCASPTDLLRLSLGEQVPIGDILSPGLERGRLARDHLSVVEQLFRSAGDKAVAIMQEQRPC